MIGPGSALNLPIYCERCVSLTYACLEVNCMSTVKALYEYGMSTEISELNLSVAKILVTLNLN